MRLLVTDPTTGHGDAPADASAAPSNASGGPEVVRTTPRIRSRTARPTNLDTPEPNERLGELIDGRYRIDAVLGHGGMGVVYRAEHIALGRPVAVKLLHPNLAALPEIRSRFEREALAVGRVNHPNCVDVSDFGQLSDGSLFMVMEYLAGKPLTALIEQSAPLAPVRALHILRQLLRGLEHAHRAGIIHRDVKPANVFLAPTANDPEAVKLVDFGIAKLVAPTHTTEVHLTQAGITFGTPVYMSPEQAMGDPADPRADLYSATVVAFEMLAGRPPFQSEDKLELLAMHANREAPQLATARGQHFAGDGQHGRDPLAPEAVAELDKLLARGLQKRPSQRYASAADYLAELDKVELALGPWLEAPDQARARRRVRRLSLGVAVCFGLAAAGWWLWPKPPAIPRPAPGTPAARAEQALERGNPTAAIAALIRHKNTATDPLAQLQLGHAYAAKREYARALDAYRKATVLDERLVAEPVMLANLRAMEQDVAPSARIAAWMFGIESLASEHGKRELLAAMTSPDADLRARARQAVDTTPLAQEAPYLASYALDLETLPTCAARKEAVARLRALGDPEALPALQKARSRKGNRCLVADAVAAIAFLKAQ